MRKPITVAREALAEIIAISDDPRVDEIAYAALKVVKPEDARTSSPKPTAKKR